MAPSQNARSGQSRQSFNLPFRRQVLRQNRAQFPVLRRSNSAPLGGWEEGEEQQEAEWACGTSDRLEVGPTASALFGCSLLYSETCFLSALGGQDPGWTLGAGGRASRVALLPPAALVFCLPQELARGGLDGGEAEAGSAPSGPTAP